MTDVDATHIVGHDIVKFFVQYDVNMIFLGESEIKYSSPSTEKQDDMESHEECHNDSLSPEQVSILQKDGKVYQNAPYMLSPVESKL